jgi:two-component system nitrate/nitrite sensor histidine kinase NarX
MKLKQTWAESTLLRVATVLGAITLIAVVVVLTAAVATERSTGKGAAINIAGSLRMQSYLLATRVAEVADPRGERARHKAAIDAEIAAFEGRVSNPRLTDAVPADAGSPLRAAYGRIESQWQTLRPLASAAADDAAARDAFLLQVHPFVADVDRLVVLLEADLESRIHGLQVALGAALFVILVLVLTAIFLLDVQVFQPIKDLARVAQSVRARDFTARAEGEGPDELGQLGRDFNHMIEELGRLYGSLEAQISAKTADLAQKNQSLSLLYETAHELSSHRLQPATLERVAANVRRVLAVDGVVICARQAPASEGFPLAHCEDRPGTICDEVRCGGCLDEARIVWHEPGRPASDPRRIVAVPLLDGEQQLGVMAVQLAAAQTMDAWQIELAQTVGRHLGAALAAEQARDEHRRLALFEERSAIARELHDSLAQSLSYTKIQIARLGQLLRERGAADGAPNIEAARDVVQELRDGVSAAYRQLRELLTTFRLQLAGKGLGPALIEALRDFRGRTGIDAELHNELIGLELSANQQIHVLQIVREALANVEHHSQARHAWVRLARHDAADGTRQIEVSIEDDGIGIARLDSPRQHFGLAIMRDRAQMVDGSLEIGRRAAGGTAVRLRFGIDAPFGVAAAAAPVPPDASATESKERVTL